MDAFSTYIPLLSFVSVYILAFVFWFQKQSEVISFLMLTILQGLFLLSFTYVLSTIVDNQFYIVSMLCWSGIGVGALFSFIALLQILITFRHLHIEYNVKHKAALRVPQQYSNLLREFKILFVTLFSFSILLFVFCIMGVGNINIVRFIGDFISQPNIVSFGPLVIPIVLCIIGLGIVGGASYEIVLANMFAELNKRHVIVR
jgi:hypothetical protein